MKKKSLVTAVVSVGLSMVLMTHHGIVAEGATKQSIIETKRAMKNVKIQAKLELIRQKAGDEVKNKVAEKIKVKEALIAEQEATAKVKEAEQQEQQQQQQKAEQAAAEQATIQETENTDVTSGASQNGREIGERNRDYGQQLSDPNLSHEQRQEIIEEKKNYNQNRR